MIVSFLTYFLSFNTSYIEVMGMIVTADVIIILCASYIIVSLVKKLNTTTATIVTSIIIYTIYEILEKFGVGFETLIRGIITNTQELIQKIIEMVELIIQQLQA